MWVYFYISLTKRRAIKIQKKKKKTCDAKMEYKWQRDHQTKALIV